MYCPVVNLIFWLRISGIQRGPIYVKLKGGHNRRQCVRAVDAIAKRRICINYRAWVDENKDEVSLTYDNWWLRWNSGSKLIGDIVTHFEIGDESPARG